MLENWVIVLPCFLDDIQELFVIIRIFELIEFGPEDQFIVECLRGGGELDFELLLDGVDPGEAMGELGPLVDLVEVVMVQAVDVERLGLDRMLILGGLL